LKVWEIEAAAMLVSTPGIEKARVGTKFLDSSMIAVRSSGLPAAGPKLPLAIIMALMREIMRFLYSETETPVNTPVRARSKARSS
jgi:hypothetical protein